MYVSSELRVMTLQSSGKTQRNCAALVMHQISVSSEEGRGDRTATEFWQQPCSAILPLSSPAASLFFLHLLFDYELFRTRLFHFKHLNGTSRSLV